MKARKIINVAGDADRLGDEYQAAKESRDAFSSKLERISSEIKTEAGKVGRAVTSKHRVLVGRKWVVGYTEVAPRVSVDSAKAAKVLSPVQLRQVTSMVVDEQKLEALYRKGVIRRSQMQQILVSSPSSQRVLVMPVQKLSELTDHENT